MVPRSLVHIINDKDKFIRLDENVDASSHFIELADGSRTSGIVLGRGDANVSIDNVSGKKCIGTVLLKIALYVPSYKQDIFSVQAATENGVSVTFSPTSTVMTAPNGTVFAHPSAHPRT